MRALAIISMLLTCVACGSHADIEIKNVWARATPPGSTMGGAYAVIESSREDELISVSTPAAQRAEMHATTEESGTMRMRPVERVALAPNAPVKFEAGGLHLMLIGLHGPLVAGTRFPLTFEFRSAAPITVEAIVVAPGDEPKSH